MLHKYRGDLQLNCCVYTDEPMPQTDVSLSVAYIKNDVLTFQIKNGSLISTGLFLSRLIQ
ncbi:Uncharacterised protein [Legionella quateirensis]|uniref:Uncharacterized protein n=1 Tax=Legionella quateirensis TaxID=45072 RepID=A0A378KS75_9GAMM|nr:hypothetical protein Lqua_0766 [Legionella quateirensis]STY16337.1 Uncharacterised protein [Legionella quateirensis]